jgi:CRP-like cAMP-binding protein
MASAAPIVDDDDGPIQSLLMKLRRRDELSVREAAILQAAVDGTAVLPAGETLVEPGQELDRAILLTDGLIARSKDLPEGQRQITEIHVPGDFVDLHGYLLKRLDHHVIALTPVHVAFVPHAALIRITEQEPHLARLLWLSTLMDSAIQRERILSIGRRPALARVAHLMCELYFRLDVVGLADDLGFPLPITQGDLANATGLTSVHVNRMLRALRDEDLLTSETGW